MKKKRGPGLPVLRGTFTDQRTTANEHDGCLNRKERKGTPRTTTENYHAEPRSSRRTDGTADFANYADMAVSRSTCARERFAEAHAVADAAPGKWMWETGTMPNSPVC